MFLAWQREARTIARLAAYRPWGFVLTGSGEPERLTGARVSADLFPLLGITPILGRTFTPDDDVFGRPRVAVVARGCGSAASDRSGTSRADRSSSMAWRTRSSA